MYRAITRALDELTALGTVEYIRDYLETQGVRGVCGAPGQCAIAVYLDRAVPGVADAVLYVDQTQADITWLPGRDREERVTVRMPSLLGAFIRRFDAGDFPGLLTADSPPSAPAPF